MVRRTVVLGGLLAISVGAAAWLYVDNGRLEDELAAARKTAADPWVTAAPAPVPDDDDDDGPAARGGPLAGLLGGRRAALGAPERPELPDTPRESRGERRVRRQQEVAALLGRLDGETEEEYRARMVPFVKTMLEKPRANVEDMRKQAEEAAQVTPAQREQIDAAINDVYGELLDYTNAAVADGNLTPYERNVAGMLEYAGGLGAILGGAEGRVGKILTADQQRAMYDTGFEWGEYLGVGAPWEQLNPPPPPQPVTPGGT